MRSARRAACRLYRLLGRTKTGRPAYQSGGLWLSSSTDELVAEPNASSPGFQGDEDAARFARPKADIAP